MTATNLYVRADQVVSTTGVPRSAPFSVELSDLFGQFGK